MGAGDVAFQNENVCQFSESCKLIEQIDLHFAENERAGIEDPGSSLLMFFG